MNPMNFNTQISDRPKNKASKNVYPATPITVSYGDGIGPEIMDATLRILEAAGAQLDIETI